MARVLRHGELRFGFYRSRRPAQKQAGGVKLELPEDVDWFIWRLVVHKRVATLTELETTWSLDDAQAAHDAIDAVEAAEAKMREPR